MGLPSVVQRETGRDAVVGGHRQHAENAVVGVVLHHHRHDVGDLRIAFGAGGEIGREGSRARAGVPSSRARTAADALPDDRPAADAPAKPPRAKAPPRTARRDTGLGSLIIGTLTFLSPGNKGLRASRRWLPDWARDEDRGSQWQVSTESALVVQPTVRRGTSIRPTTSTARCQIEPTSTATCHAVRAVTSGPAPPPHLRKRDLRAWELKEVQ